MGQLASQLQRGLCLATILSVASWPHSESRGSVAIETFLVSSETTYKECMNAIEFGTQVHFQSVDKESNRKSIFVHQGCWFEIEMWSNPKVACRKLMPRKSVEGLEWIPEESCLPD